MDSTNEQRRRDSGTGNRSSYTSRNMKNEKYKTREIMNT